MAQSAIQGSSSPVVGARGAFGFDLTKPLRGGWLLKQGGSHKAFKKRFFVLYPGFLIYYNSPDKYKYDVARSTLAVSCRERLSAGGGCVLCRNPSAFAPPSLIASTFSSFLRVASLPSSSRAQKSIPPNTRQRAVTSASLCTPPIP